MYAFIELLPPWGQYKTAMVMDEGWARNVLDMEEAGQGLPPTGEIEEGGAPSPLYYDPVVARMELIADRVMAVRTAVQAGYADEHKEPQFEPIVRPMTAIDRERERRTRSELEVLENQLLRGEGLVLELLAEE